MGKLIEFRPERLPSKLRKRREMIADNKGPGEAGKILFFTGVRYESAAGKQNNLSRPLAGRR